MADELITLEEAKRHLRITQSGFDDEVTSALQAAREFAEGWTARTLRPATSRTLALDCWWFGQLGLPYPPLIEITNIKYYTGGIDTALSSSNYRAILSAEGQGWLEWADSATQPSTDARSDAVRVTYTAGYTAETFPAKAKYAILMKLTEIWGDGKGRDLEYAERSSKSLLYSVDWGHYS